MKKILSKGYSFYFKSKFYYLRCKNFLKLKDLPGFLKIFVLKSRFFLPKLPNSRFPGKVATLLDC